MDEHDLDLGPARSWWKKGSEPTSAESALLKNHKAIAYSVLGAYWEHGDMTADECAEALGESILSIRPSVSRLKKYGYLHVSTDSSGRKIRRPNESTRLAMVHRISGKGLDALAKAVS